MGCFSLSCIGKCLAGLLLFCVLITFLPGLPPYNSQFTAFELPLIKNFTGPLSLNNKLDKVEKLFLNQLHGPEALVSHNGILYTGTHGGQVYKIVGDKLLPFVKFGKKCTGELTDEALCGRPLGMFIDKKGTGTLYVCDAYYGLFTVDLATGGIVRLVSPDDVIEGRKAKIFNSVTVGSDGMVYWTDSDSNFYLYDAFMAMFADGTGRLIKYDPVKKSNTVLIDRLHFANGVALSSTESFVLVAETIKMRVLRYHLKGQNKGRWDVFVDGLPGMTDNLKADGRGSFYVPLVSSVDEQNSPAFMLKLSKYPMVRKFIARLLAVTEMALEYVGNSVASFKPFCTSAVHSIGHFETSRKFLDKSKRQTIVLVNENGQIVNSYHSTKGEVSGICDVEEVGGYLYLGSPFNHFLGRVKM